MNRKEFSIVGFLFSILVMVYMVSFTEKENKETQFPYWEIINEMKVDSVEYVTHLNGRTANISCIYYVGENWVVGQPDMRVAYAYNSVFKRHSYVTIDSMNNVKSVLSNF